MATRITAHENKSVVALLGILCFLQSPGLTVADTKHDLAANPWGFLQGATQLFAPWGLQNQAYGYLWPQGLFFALTDFFPDWVAQRLWWWLLLTVAYTGTVALLRNLGYKRTLLPALLYAFCPRILTTVGAISSEAWVVALVPWTVAPLANSGSHHQQCKPQLSLLAVACMGAVNATATLAALIPAGLVLLARRAWKALAIWCVGVIAVSAWWIGPLLILGKYSPPFTDYIESAYVTTRWLNPLEILRGTTSWAPFVDNERTAGFLLVTVPLLILATVAVAALGLRGITGSPWVMMVLVGLAVLSFQSPLLDGSLAAFRNLHKFTPLVTIPLVIGVAWLCDRANRTSLVALGLVTCVAISPALTGQLAPKGAYREVPTYYQETADFLNAQGKAVLITPERSFSREDWGWTRDDPLQPLLRVPWTVRDAIPIADPEYIRGLDGLMANMSEEALRGFGIGYVVTRGEVPGLEGLPKKTFGPLTVVRIRPTDNRGVPIKVAGGGESVALLDGIHGPAMWQLVDKDATIVTDTPALVERNYGTLDGAVSGILAPGETTGVKNKVKDYASVGPRTAVEEIGGHVTHGPDVADPTRFGGAEPEHSVTAAVDGFEDTAWYGTWLELHPDKPGKELKLVLTAGEAEVTAGGRTWTMGSGTVTLPEPVDSIHVRPAHGIAEAELSDAPIRRVATVPDTSPDVQQFVFAGEGRVTRAFTAPRDMDVIVDAEATLDGEEVQSGETVRLTGGRHEVSTLSPQITLTVPGFELPGGDSIITTARSFNPGVQGFIDGTELQPIRIRAGQQGFIVPAGVDGKLTLAFVAEDAYRWSLILGFLLLIATVGVCIALRRRTFPAQPAPTLPAWVGLILIGLALGPWALLAAVAGWCLTRYVSPSLLIGLGLGVPGVWLALAPWPSPTYPAGSLAVTIFIAVALGAALHVQKE
ncbi:MAG: alpha-(1-_3)-arabinofuranosyltransferase family protein [Corynebacterium glucuronolyticum]|nr:alpha-(1->3)-arabinofuranosyltransferase family protein [Mycobacteriaceae bacterium]MDY5834538.1 alpha-(1->3)-arabinofuranosyltransferase family protein [Corynebacterium glucuronolyticum]